ncbi:MAG: aminopeptidase P N-terminal domain-containing protein, partial [Gammaproteobacteria bacterium]
MDAKEFKSRRKRLMDMMGDESVAILPTASVHIRNNDVEFPFRPDSDFYYLTGYPEPEAVAVIIPDRTHGEYVLFCRERDPKKETWDGKRAGLEGACKIYGADDAFPIEDMDDILPNMLEDRERIFYTMGHDAVFDQRVLGWVNEVRDKARTGVNAPNEFISLTHILHDMRLYKSRQEISAMRKAARISANAHKSAMQICQPGLMEYQLEAEIVHKFMQQGARLSAYPSIVGGGANSCILHYTDNQDELKDGDILLI